MGFISKIAINRLVNSTTPRPRAFSLWSHLPAQANTPPISGYTSWESLTDRSWSGRHLPPASDDYMQQLPFAADIANTARQADHTFPADLVDRATVMHKRTAGFVEDRSTVLFAFFAQWFTDSFLRFDPKDRRKNTSNHEIDMCQVYGLTPATTRLLRTGSGGKLKSRLIDGAEYLPLFFDSSHQPDGEYDGLPYKDKIDFFLKDFPQERRDFYYATGLDRGNSTIGYTAISTMFLREHNRICEELIQHYGWSDDERVFQTARNIVIVLLLKVIVEDYIGHIAGASIFEVDIGFSEDQSWYRTNWISAEFDLLYRWHQLVPENLTIAGNQHGHKDFRFNNALLEQYGVEQVLRAAATQPGGKICLHNTGDFLLNAEYEAIKMSRDFKLRSYNDYREQFGLRRVKSFKKLTDNRAVRAELKALYGNIDNLDFLMGLFAEDSDGSALFGDLMTRMVAADAFSQALTNPLLSENIFNEHTFTAYGMELIESTSTLSEIAERNNKSGTSLGLSFSL
jgi:prostaglandin-endoperoxide synthase 2